MSLALSSLYPLQSTSSPHFPYPCCLLPRAISLACATTSSTTLVSILSYPNAVVFLFCRVITLILLSYIHHPHYITSLNPWLCHEIRLHLLPYDYRMHANISTFLLITCVFLVGCQLCSCQESMRVAFSRCPPPPIFHCHMTADFQSVSSTMLAAFS